MQNIWSLKGSKGTSTKNLVRQVTMANIQTLGGSNNNESLETQQKALNQNSRNKKVKYRKKKDKTDQQIPSNRRRPYTWFLALPSKYLIISNDTLVMNIITIVTLILIYTNLSFQYQTVQYTVR